MKRKPIVQFIPIIALLVLCIAIFSLITSLTSTIRRKSMLQARKDNLSNLQEKNKELEKELQIVQSQEFIEREARDKLNLAKPGDTVILMGKNIQTDISQPILSTPLTNWKKWWSLFF